MISRSTESPARRNRLFPLGIVGPVVLTTVFTQWMVFYHVEHTPMARREESAQALAWTLAAGFTLQAFVSPLVGFSADLLAARGFRRLVLVSCGTPVLGAAFFLLWSTTHPVAMLALFALYSIGWVATFQMYNAVLPCMSETDQGRLTLASWSALLGLGATILALIGAPVVIEHASYRALGALATALLLTTTWPLSFVLRERPVQRTPIGWKDLGPSVRRVLGHPGIPSLFLGLGTFLYGITTFNMGLPFLLKDTLAYSNARMSAFNATSSAGLLLAVGLTFATYRYVGLRRLTALLSSVGALALGAISWNLTGGHTDFVDWWPVVVLGGSAVFALVLPNVVIARYVDELGTRHQGSVYGLNGVVVGVANAAAGLTVAHPLARQMAPQMLPIVATSWMVAAVCFGLRR